MRQWRNVGSAVLFLCSALVLASCSGSSGGGAPSLSLPSPAAVATQTPAVVPAGGSGTVGVAFTLKIPTASGGRPGARRPDYVSAGTHSASISVSSDGTADGKPVVLNCSSGQTCSTSVPAPQGSDTFTVRLFAGTGGGGALLGIGSTTQSVTSGAANTVAVTLNGVVNSVALTLTTPSGLPAGTTATEKVAVDALDAAGFTIVAPGGYVDTAGTPVTITVTNTDYGKGNGKTTLASPHPVATGSGTTLSYTYNGSDIDATKFTTTTSSAILGSQGSALVTYVPTFIKHYQDATGSDTNFITAGSDGNLWFTDFGDGDIGSISPTTGAIVHYSIPSSILNGGAEPEGIVQGPNGMMYFAEFNSNSIGAISTTLAATLGTATPITETLLTTTNANPRGVAYDAACSPNVWFTEFNGNKIGTLSTTTMTVTEYSTGLTAAAEPDQIACGPDGNFWFTEFGAGKIGKITTAGIITEYALPMPAAAHAPIGIVAGLDGSMWFAESAGNMISKIATSKTLPAGSAVGAIVEYPIPTPPANPYGATMAPSVIMTAPDGDLFFSEYNSETGSTNAMIGRFTTTASVAPGSVPDAFTQYPLTATSNMPFGITLGPDGHIWFTEMGSEDVGYLIY